MGEKKAGIKWFVTIVASSLFTYSTIFRVYEGKEVDPTLCFMFAFIAGLPWGANLLDYFKR
jgi:hypothetical protein